MTRTAWLAVALPLAVLPFAALSRFAAFRDLVDIPLLVTIAAYAVGTPIASAVLLRRRGAERWIGGVALVLWAALAIAALLVMFA